ncbi:MAG: aminoglycoside phosphotransferase family protein [Firmicutes bacterium]|nr:aminoglycoside phosphotransferase family protein [Bacillota bacterium]
MNQVFLPENAPLLREVLGAYDFPETLLGAVRYGQGHINDTYCVLCQPREGDCVRYILQGLSSAAFPHPEELMENFVSITSYLREKIAASGGDPMRETLSVIKTKNGSDYYTDANGKVWRLMPFIENTDCFQSATPELFEASARTFGRFQRLLQGYPAETLHETVPHFHDTEDRFAKFQAAVAADKLGRAKEVQEEIRFVLERQGDCSVALDALRAGKLPLRVTHNDTKLNNILIDRDTREGICVIDLDTTMPGLSINDFGDSIRFGANHSAEDEKDLSKVNFDLGLYEAYTRGFLEGAGGTLTEAELEYLPWGARLMTLECGIRFLTDYLDGDHYFHIRYPEQNLDRCRTQFKLVRDMEAHFDQMNRIVQSYKDRF